MTRVYLNKEIYVCGDLTIETQYEEDETKTVYYGAAGNLHRNLVANDVNAVLLIPSQLFDAERCDDIKHKIVHKNPTQMIRERIYRVNNKETSIFRNNRCIESLSDNETQNVFPKYTSTVVCLEQHFDEVESIAWWLSCLKTLTESVIFIDFRNKDVLFDAFKLAFTREELNQFCLTNNFVFKHNQHVPVSTSEIIDKIELQHKNFLHVRTFEDGSVVLSDKIKIHPLHTREPEIESRVRCTIGCGDAFFGAFISGFLALCSSTYRSSLTALEWSVCAERGVYAGTVSAFSPGVKAISYPEAFQMLTDYKIVEVVNE